MIRAEDGHHGWASAEWLMLLRTMLLQEEGETLVLTPSLPAEWLESPGQLSVKAAPTAYGEVSFSVDWDEGGGTMKLELDGQWRTPPQCVVWRVRGAAVTFDASQKNAILVRE